MDRREALKKLGTGTAIAAASPVLLPSFRVAHAASGGLGNTGLVGVPDSGDAPAWYPVAGSGSSQKRDVGIVFDNADVSCADGSTAEFSVEWRIASVVFDASGPSPRMIRVSSGGNVVASMPFVTNGYNGGSYGPVAYAESFTVDKLRDGNKDDLLRPQDSYQLEARCRWHCAGASEDLVAEYNFSGTANNSPTVWNVSWDSAASA